MVTILSIKTAPRVVGTNTELRSLYDIAGLSSDTKPTAYGSSAVTNGSTFLEMDTGKVYMYDEDGSTWREI